MKRKPSEIAAIAGLAIVAVCCVCGLLAWTAFDALGWVVTAPLRWFQRQEPSEITLRQVLEDRGSARFTFGENCTYTYTQGTAIRSNPDSGAGEGFASELPAEQVIAAVEEFLGSAVFQAESGGLALVSGAPVRTSLLAGDEVSLGFDEEQANSTTVLTRSLNGVVAGNTFTGTYQITEDTSTVVDGQGVEEAMTLTADFTCPIQWISTID